MTDELTQLAALQREISTARASRALKSADSRGISLSSFSNSACLVSKLARHGLLQEKLHTPARSTRPVYYDTATDQPGQMGDRGPK